MEAMKEGLNVSAINRISASFLKIYPDFDVDSFRKTCLEGLDELELKERVEHIIRALNKSLPNSFDETAVLLQNLPKAWDWGKADDPKSGFAAWPVIDYVARYGMEQPQVALDCLQALTHLFSAEFAIRPFLIAHTDLSFKRMQEWSLHESEHVRRLASEGCRPRLPWGIQLKQYIQDPKPLLDILERLKNDPSLYVRRSVANNLNDISKDHPDLVLGWCKQWLSTQGTDQENVAWVVKHASRSLVKAGHPRSFELLGHSADPKVNVGELNLASNSVSIGEDLEFSFELTSEAEQQSFVLDYAVHYQKANGQTKPKVFKLKNLVMGQGKTQSISKKHSFREVTTRKLYRGTHKIAIHVNGVEKASVDFLLR